MDYLENIVARNVKVALEADKFAAQAHANAVEWERRAKLAESEAIRRNLLARAKLERKGANI